MREVLHLGGTGISKAPRAVVDEATAIGVVFANLIADLLYAAFNPRIRYKVRGPYHLESLMDKDPRFEH